MKQWLKKGLIWGMVMFISVTFILNLVNGSEITLKKVLIDLVFWTTAGFFFGFVLKDNFEKES